jgi:hypothetical protein
MTDDKDEIAALRAEIAANNRRIEELERKAKPPEPIKEDPNWRRYDPTANMTMPLSTLREMVNAVPDSVMRGILRDNRAPNTPSMRSPGDQVTGASRGSAPGGGTGWVDPVPLGPSPHARYVDAQIDAQDRKDRQERVQQAAQSEASRRFVEQSKKLDRAIEQTRKQLTEPKP